MNHSLSSLVSTDDPRLSRDDFREIPSTDGGGRIVLVGVVHEHPASVFRVRQTVRAIDPDIVALELPSLALPLFERYARAHDGGTERAPAESDESGADGDSPAPPGGEMSAAIGAARDARVVGIDLPNVRYGGAVIDAVQEESLSVRGVRRATRAFGAQFLHAVHCRIAYYASRVGITLDPQVDSGEYDSTPSTSPKTQATEEATLVGAGTALLRAFNRPPALRTFDSAREAAMADALSDLRTDGSVVAVVGHAHLNAITETLEADSLSE